MKKETLSVVHLLKMESLRLVKDKKSQNSALEKVIGLKIESKFHLNLITAIVIKEDLDHDHTRKVERTISYKINHHFIEVIQGQKNAAIVNVVAQEIEEDADLDQMIGQDIEEDKITTEVIEIVGIDRRVEVMKE